MKIAIIGDLHFGIRGNSLAHLEFQTNWFRNELLPSLTKNKCDGVIFLGDVFDSRVALSPIILRRVRELFKQLTSSIKNVSCILGNHDIYFRNNKTIHSLDVLIDQGVTLYETPSEVTIDGLNALFLPWILEDELSDIKSKLVNNEYDLCFGHLEINNFEMVKNVVEENGLTQDLFSNCKNVYSGHFHLRRDHKNIQYVGTPYELTWNDHADTKGYYIYNTETKKDTFVKSVKTPQHVRVLNHLLHLEDINSDLIKNNIVKVIFDTKISETDKINYIEKINSLEPMSLTVDDEVDVNFDSDCNIEADIKDTLGFLNDYMNIIEIPEELDKKLIIEKIEEIHNRCI